MPDLSIPRVFQRLLCPGGLWAISGWSWLKTFCAGKCVMETPLLTVELSVVGSWSLHRRFIAPRGFITPGDSAAVGGPTRAVQVQFCSKHHSLRVLNKKCKRWKASANADQGSVWKLFAYCNN